MKIIVFILTKKMYLAHNFQSSIWLGKNNWTYKKIDIDRRKEGKLHIWRKNFEKKNWGVNKISKNWHFKNKNYAILNFTGQLKIFTNFYHFKLYFFIVVHVIYPTYQKISSGKSRRTEKSILFYKAVSLKNTSNITLNEVV